MMITRNEETISQDSIWKARFSGFITGFVSPILFILTGIILGICCLPISILLLLFSPLTAIMGGIFGLGCMLLGKAGSIEEGAILGFVIPVVTALCLPGAFFGPSLLCAGSLTGVLSNRTYTKAFQTGKIHWGFGEFWQGLKFICNVDLQIAQREYPDPSPYGIALWFLNLPWIVGSIIGGAAVSTAISAPMGGVLGGLSGGSTGAMLALYITNESGQLIPVIQKTRAERPFPHLTEWNMHSAKIDRETLKQELRSLLTRIEQREIPPPLKKLLIELADRAGLDLCHKASPSSYTKALHIKSYLEGYVAFGIDYLDKSEEATLREQIKLRRKDHYGLFKKWEDRGSPAIMQDIESNLTSIRQAETAARRDSALSV